MKLHDLHPPKGSTHDKKRLGRGTGSGLGKTSGRGHKGQKARSGGGVRPGFEGGQMPLVRRLPKRGFTNIFATNYAIINVGVLDKLADGTEVTLELLLQERMLKKAESGLKILGNGELTKKLQVKAHKISETAREKIEKAGGTVEVIS